MKRKDDVEVEGHGLLLEVDEDEVTDEQKPTYAGHVVAVIERVGGQLFSGSLGLLRPSSAATKEKQEAERREREATGEISRSRHSAHQERPKIVWFKPTDKRVPLIAIPTEQAPRDFVDNPQKYSSTLFVACIKRWPITSLHPFGTLVEELGAMKDMEVETEAILRDNNCMSEPFSESLLSSIPPQALDTNSRRDFRDINVMTIDTENSIDLDNAVHVRDLDNGNVELGVHIADVSHYVRPNSAMDREARKRAISVHLVQRTVPLLPPKLAQEICSFTAGKDKLAFSIVYTMNKETGEVVDTWIGKSIVKSRIHLSFNTVQSIIEGKAVESVESELQENVRELNRIAQLKRNLRIASGAIILDYSPLNLHVELDDKQDAVGCYVEEKTLAKQLIEEILLVVDATVAEKLATMLPEGAFLRRQDPPPERRINVFMNRLSRLGYEFSDMSSSDLQKGISSIKDSDIRKALDTLFTKLLLNAKYFVAGQVTEDRYSHYGLNKQFYTHFTSPLSRYADIITHRQLQSILIDGVGSPGEDYQSLVKLAESVNLKSDGASIAKQQSSHMYLCKYISEKTEIAGPLVVMGVVLNVQASSFDVIIPNFGIERRVHLDQLPLVKAEFNEGKHILELFWEKGVSTTTHDENTNTRCNSTSSHWRSSIIVEDALALDVGLLNIEEDMALFDNRAEAVEESPKKFTRSSGSIKKTDGNKLESSSSSSGGGIGGNKQQVSGETVAARLNFKIDNVESVGENNIQTITEFSKLPVVLVADIERSPFVLSVRALNPFFQV